MLKIFATRAVTEIERRRADEALRGERGAVPRDLQRLGRRAGPSRRGFPDRRRQLDLRGLDRHSARTGDRIGPRAGQPARRERAREGAARPRSGRRADPARNAAPAPGRQLPRARAARHADTPPWRAARPLRRARHHGAQARRERAHSASRPAAPGAEDGGDRPPDRRHRARLQQHPDQHPGLHRPGPASATRPPRIRSSSSISTRRSGHRCARAT